MAVERLKIRCYQCNQLLAVSPNRAGTVVACPKCKADLLIPRQETLSKGDGDGDDPGLAGNPSSSVKAPSSAAGSPSALSESSPFMAEIAAMIPPELAALRPEDLRVEAEFFETLTNEPPVALHSHGSLPVPPIVLVGNAAGDSGDTGFAQPRLRTAPIAATPSPIAAPPPLPVPRVNVVVPPIQLDTSPILPPTTEARRIREVTLPATVVLAWSVFVLASVAMSFIAGLMIGHFLWRMPP